MNKIQFNRSQTNSEHPPQTEKKKSVNALQHHVTSDGLDTNLEMSLIGQLIGKVAGVALEILVGSTGAFSSMWTALKLNSLPANPSLGLTQIFEAFSNRIVRNVCSPADQIFSIPIFGMSTSTRVAKEDVHKQFEVFYMEKFGHLEGIRQDQGLLKETLDTIFAISEEIEFNPHAITDKMLNDLNEINNLSIHNKNLSESSKMLLNDVILFTCLTPVINQRQTISRFQRFSIEVLTPGGAQSIVEDMKRKCAKERDPMTSLYLNHMTEGEYAGASLSKKMALLNLSQLKQESKNKILKDPIFNKIIENEKQAFKYMFACSGAMEQYYLNTCTPTTICQEVISNVLLLPQAFSIAQDTLHVAVGKSTTCDDPLIKEYLQRRIKKEQDHLDDLRNQFSKLMESDNPSIEELHQLTQEWSKGMQRLGLLVYSDFEGHPTKKVIANQWLLSAILAIPVVLLSHLFGASKNPPFLSMRITGAAFVRPNSLITDKKLHLLSGLLSELIDPNKLTQPSDRELIMLWQLINERGCLPVTNFKHSISIKAVMENGQCVFLLSDPKAAGYVKYSLRNCFLYLKKNNYS